MRVSFSTTWQTMRLWPLSNSRRLWLCFMMLLVLLNRMRPHLHNWFLCSFFVFAHAKILACSAGQIVMRHSRSRSRNRSHKHGQKASGNTRHGPDFNSNFRLSSRTIFGASRSKNFSQISAIYACKLVQLLATHRFPLLLVTSSWLALLTNICTKSAIAYFIFVAVTLCLLRWTVDHFNSWLPAPPGCNADELQTVAAESWPWMAHLNALSSNAASWGPLAMTCSSRFLFVLQLFLLQIKRFLLLIDSYREAQSQVLIRNWCVYN